MVLASQTQVTLVIIQGLTVGTFRNTWQILKSSTWFLKEGKGKGKRYILVSGFLIEAHGQIKKKEKKEENRGKQRKEKVPVLSGIQTRDLLRSVTNIPIAPINTSLVHWHKLSIYWTAGLFYYHGRLHLTNGLKQTWYSGPFVIHFLSSVAHSHFDLLSQFLT